MYFLDNLIFFTIPFLIKQLLATRTVPPTAIVFGSSMKGTIAFVRASGAKIESASKRQIIGERLKLIAALCASALPPFTLSITRNRLSLREI